MLISSVLPIYIILITHIDIGIKEFLICLLVLDKPSQMDTNIYDMSY